jgi:hypothetical protein
MRCRHRRHRQSHLAREEGHQALAREEEHPALAREEGHPALEQRPALAKEEHPVGQLAQEGLQGGLPAPERHPAQEEHQLAQEGLQERFKVRFYPYS